MLKNGKTRQEIGQNNVIISSIFNEFDSFLLLESFEKTVAGIGVGNPKVFSLVENTAFLRGKHRFPP